MIRGYINIKLNINKKISRRCHYKRKDDFPPRFNKVNVHMIGAGLWHQLFNQQNHPIEKNKYEKCIKELLVNNLLRNENIYIQNINFPLPKLRGDTLEEHFYQLGYEYSYPYSELVAKLINGTKIEFPSIWTYAPGWTRYNSDGTYESVDYPTCDILVFDVETCVRRKSMPIMAVAISDKYIYSWVSEHFYNNNTPISGNEACSDIPLDHLIPMGLSDTKPRLVIGHHIAFDRSYIKEEYLPTPNFMNFFDTMSMHIVMSGYAEAQRTYLNKKRVTDKKVTDPGEESSDIPSWIDRGSFNSLEALTQYYLNRKIDKQSVDTFVKGDFEDIRDKFNELMLYCATDVITTRDLFIKIWPNFIQSASHPITFAGMMMLSKCYFPLTDRWKNFVQRSEMIYNNYQNEMQVILTKLAQESLQEGLKDGDSYKNHPWLSHLDWSIADFNKTDNIEKYMRIPYKEKWKYLKHLKMGRDITKQGMLLKNDERFKQFCDETNLFCDLPTPSDVEFEDKQGVGYPRWFVELTRNTIYKQHIVPRPSELLHSARLIPLILKLSWRGFPIHYHKKYQWCYVIPKYLLTEGLVNIEGNIVCKNHAVKPYYIVKANSDEANRRDDESHIDEYIEKDYFYERIFGIYPDESYSEFRRKPHSKPEYKSFMQNNNANVYEDISGDTVYVPIPHPEGKKKWCGNPLGSEYHEYFLDGIIVPMCGEEGVRYIHLLSPISFWRNNRDRIFELTTVYYKPNEIPFEYKKNSGIVGSIVPRVIPAGTVTRRAVERTWLTVINPKTDIVGSEFKSAIIAPDGFCFVGADVDSEEMWIASLIADAATVGLHGATPFSYMSIRGTKQNESDLHTVTAKAVGINRDDAKILNYGRLYGAGVEFARSMIKQYQPHLSDNEAAIKAIYLYNFTKGLKCCELTKAGLVLLSNTNNQSPNLLTKTEFQKLMRSNKIKAADYPKYGTFYWQGGTESEIFNVLEQFALSDTCRTPFLGVSIPSSLTSKAVGIEFLTSRMNWVVQSSAVDFLHMFLVTSYWLFSLLKIPARLCICVHDEIRFMVPEDKRYHAALALHVSNLFTRSAFSQKVGIHDLPQSCSFFSAVDIDKVLRKEPSVDCKTPSNPEGVGDIINGFKCEVINIWQAISKVGDDIFTEEKLSQLKESNIFDNHDSN